ncbi:MAG: hypothetical protein WEB30_05815 [Cyclobacteriaceae bacterium]
MSEHDHDRLEEFFRKASVRADVPFNEMDWKKLEARLDAVDPSGISGAKKAGGKVASAVVVGVVLLFTGAVWINSEDRIIDFETDKTAHEVFNEENEVAIEDSNDHQSFQSDENKNADNNGEQLQISAPLKGESSTTDEIRPLKRDTEISKPATILTTDQGRRRDDASEESEDMKYREDDPTEGMTVLVIDQLIKTATLGNEKVFRELIEITPANAEKIKQRANVDLPGAEEGDTGKAKTIVAEEDASVKQLVAPRLSLLLSFAPDFSSTSNQYSAPGNAFGAVIHYHVFQRWSVSAGIIRNNKRYTGAGEDYSPPKGYWKYYTNGIVPESVDGACAVLEFPVMIQYTIASNGRNRWTASAGTSNYLMLNESYRYYFDEPNPGAKEGWDSKRQSRFYFNMFNISVGYEHQLFPGLMVGIEPYVKVPLEEIGWSNIRLFSTGASFTLRYKILGKKNTLLPVFSRGPD